MKNRLFQIMAILGLLMIILISPLKAEASSVLGTGVDGELVVNAGQTLYIDQWYNNKYGAGQYMITEANIPNFSKVTIQSGGKLTVSAWNGSTGVRFIFK